MAITVPRARRWRRQSLLALVAAVAVAVPANVLNGSATLAHAPEFGARIDPNEVRESLAYLMRTFGVTEAEALRRLELQSAAQKLDARLRRERSDVYGGMALDQENGGALVVSMTDPAAANPYLAALPNPGHVRMKRVSTSVAQLEEVAKRLSTKVQAGRDAIFLPAVDEDANQVVLWERPWVKDAKRAGNWAAGPSGSATASRTSAQERGDAVAKEAATADAAAVAEGKVVVRKTAVRPQPLYSPYVNLGYCHPLYCNVLYGPMRGGLRLDIKRDNGSWGGCTAGFNVRSHGGAYPNFTWVLTAGHCVVGKSNTTNIQHNGYNVLRRHRNLEFNSFPYDYALMPYIDGPASQMWLENHSGRNRVLKYCRNGGMDSNADTPCGTQATSTDVNLTGTHSLAEIKAGWVVCASGSASSAVNYPDSHDSGAGAGYLVGTRCGKVTSTDLAINTDICARAGDSGGPLFSQVDKTAYGILEGSLQRRTGPCYAGERNNYIPISTILRDVNKPGSLNGGSTFGLILSSSG